MLRGLIILHQGSTVSHVSIFMPAQGARNIFRCLHVGKKTIKAQEGAWCTPSAFSGKNSLPSGDSCHKRGDLGLTGLVAFRYMSRFIVVDIPFSCIGADPLQSNSVGHDSTLVAELRKLFLVTSAIRWLTVIKILNSMRLQF